MKGGWSFLNWELGGRSGCLDMGICFRIAGIQTGNFWFCFVWYTMANKRIDTKHRIYITAYSSTTTQNQKINHEEQHFLLFFLVASPLCSMLYLCVCVPKVSEAPDCDCFVLKATFLGGYLCMWNFSRSARICVRIFDGSFIFLTKWTMAFGKQKWFAC